MQRDMELFRKVLFKVEELPFDGGARQIEVEGYDDENTTYHVKLAIDAGFLDAINVSHQTGKAYLVSGLTYSGHEFLDSIKSETVWEKSKAFLKGSVGEITVTGLKTAVPMIVKSLLAAHLPK
jgi:hypothetical protein